MCFLLYHSGVQHKRPSDTCTWTQWWGTGDGSQPLSPHPQTGTGIHKTGWWSQLHTAHQFLPAMRQTDGSDCFPPENKRKSNKWFKTFLSIITYYSIDNCRQYLFIHTLHMLKTVIKTMQIFIWLILLIILTFKQSQVLINSLNCCVCVCILITCKQTPIQNPWFMVRVYSTIWTGKIHGSW